MSLPKIYLAGAIRDDAPADIEWRQYVRRSLGAFKTSNGPIITGYDILDPLDGKTYNHEHGWLMHGSVKATGDIFVHRDLAMIHHADVILANLSALQDGYPCIGTLMELGIAMERRILTVVVGAYGVIHHPFIASMAYRRVATVDAAIDWLKAERRWL